MTNISAEKAGPLKQLNAHANGYLAEEEGREAQSLERERETCSISDCHYPALSEPIRLVHMSLCMYVFAYMWAESSTQMGHGGETRKCGFFL